MTTISYNEVKVFAVDMNRRLQAGAFGPVHVHLETTQGVRMTLPRAFADRHGPWYIVYCEHHEPLIFGDVDVSTIYEFTVTRRRSEIDRSDILRRPDDPPDDKEEIIGLLTRDLTGQMIGCPNPDPFITEDDLARMRIFDEGAGGEHD